MARASKKLFYRIGEVCRICGLEPHVLRYWETEFTLLSPSKNRAGQRIYREKELQLIQQIKRMLYQEGYTISGANRKLLEDGRSSLPLFRRSRDFERSRVIREIRREVQSILKMLDG